MHPLLLASQLGTEPPKGTRQPRLEATSIMGQPDAIQLAVSCLQAPTAPQARSSSDQKPASKDAFAMFRLIVAGQCYQQDGARALGPPIPKVRAALTDRRCPGDPQVSYIHIVGIFKTVLRAFESTYDDGCLIHYAAPLRLCYIPSTFALDLVGGRARQTMSRQVGAGLNSEGVVSIGVEAPLSRNA